MRVILSGGGAGEKTKEIDELFASIIDKNKPLLYIPVAIDKVKHPYSECLKWLRGTFDNLKVNLYEMWTESDFYKSKITSPDKFGGIYIGGGNTFYLLKILKESGFWEFLMKALKIGIPVYGGSAGAIIFGESILTSSDKNLVGLKEFSGMNLLKDISFFCHYKPEKDEKIKKSDISKILALSERTGVYIKDDKAIVIGQEPAYLFFNKNKKKINVGQLV